MPYTEQQYAMFERIAKRHTTILESEYTRMPCASPIKAVMHLATYADPLPKKKYTEWLVMHCDELNWREHELVLLGDFLETYDRLKHLFPIEHRDLYKFKSISAFKAVFNQLRYDYRDQIHAFNAKKTTHFEETGQIRTLPLNCGKKLIAIQSADAAYHFSRGTRWCFNSRSNDNMYEKYRQRGSAVYFIRSDTINCAFAVNNNKIVECRDNRSETYEAAPAIIETILADNLINATAIPNIAMEITETGQRTIRSFINEWSTLMRSDVFQAAYVDPLAFNPHFAIDYSSPQSDDDSEK
jgi:hypothetical protein